MIDLTQVRDVLDDVLQLVDQLDGLELDASRAITDQSKGRLRQERAEKSQQLQLLATRLELAAALTRVQFWTAKGERNPLQP